MTTDTRTEAERRYDALKDGSAYTKPSAEQPEHYHIALARQADSILAEDDAEQPATLMLAVANLIDDDDRAICEWIDQQAEARALIDAKDSSVTIEHQDGWDEYTAGAIDLTHDYAQHGKRGPFMLYIHGIDIEETITYALLVELARDLNHLINDPRVQAILGACPGCATAPAGAAFCEVCGRKL